MKNETYALGDGLEVLRTSILELDICTDDADGEGCRITNGTNRSLAMGITPDGDPIIYIATNGDPILITEAAGEVPDDLVGACWALGDAPDGAVRRVRMGIGRIAEAVASIRSIYGDTGAMSDALGWYDDRVREIGALSDAGIGEIVSRGEYA